MAARAEVTLLDEGDGDHAPHVPDYVVDLEAWTRRFERWISVTVNQPLDPLRPRGALISPRGLGIVSWMDDSGGARLVTRAGTGTTQVVVRGGGPSTWHDELAVSLDVFSEVVARANGADQPSVVADLWCRAQHALSIKDYRACLVDLGTIAEAALAHLDPDKRLEGTLGQKVRRVEGLGVALPWDIDEALVTPRNRVLHDAYLPSRAEAVRAGEIIEMLVADVRGPIGFVAEVGGEPAHRPQRADLTIFQST